MKTVALALGGFVFLLAGCAHERAVVASYESPALAAPEEAIWKRKPVAEGRIKNTAVIWRFRGLAVISEDGKTWKRGAVGGKLKAGSFVQTDLNGTLDIFLGENGPYFRLKPDTAIRIERLDLDNTGIEKVIDTRFELQRGEILGSVKKLSSASVYLVRTPTSVLQIRGTEFLATSENVVNVVSGTVDVSLGGQTLGINAEQKFAPATGIKMMSAPEIDFIRNELADVLNLFSYLHGTSEIINR